MIDTAAEPFSVDTEQAVVVVTGEDRIGYLQDVTTQDLEGLEPGEVRGALRLDQHGGPLAMFDVVARDDRLWLVVADAGLAEDAVETLGSRTFLQDATFEASDLVVHALRGEGVAQRCAEAGLPDAPVDEPGRAVAADELLLIGRPGGVDLVGAAAPVEDAVERLRAAGVRDGTAEELEASRIRAGVPAWQREVTAPHLPEEIGLLPTHVHLEKGCYPGQEAIARMWMLGRPRRRLARVTLEPPVEAGTQLGSGRDKVRVTSVAPGDGHAPALAFVPTGTEAGDALELEEATVTVHDIVNADRPVPGHDPSTTRRRDE